ncbi:hypothetical protein SPRG_08862 [Saprolegnia parasitica CBS 223.65]|uniref:DUS-like FMN-binding domain-containing protein n=1 Tax=Saprolegnia parasitica (strain CBS 223.65) TaxID=695850 RepID=A0A067CH95_SAPPC|nr:hypothetical protein SPRG_08862 [Saprolegnia parasitica CBS 223.65]KDO25921.1 hypothetical protein SPRG_08862 [Saprolegnia parasitica CBS 223.65]|eukprot:XP_012203481.1 hypothetical protein SPRG_08862 [Saprolegnia parasitica CBS 223.65]
MASFWRQLPRPFYCVAPMANVTDVAFRAAITELGKPHVMWTEFVSCEALMSSTARTREKMLTALKYAPSERPIVAQLFGSKPDQFRECAKIVRDLGFDGIDINMGCPEKNVNKQGSGAALIGDPVNAQAIVRACQESGLPVSVKTRIGLETIDYHDWINYILDTEPDALTVHGRTRKEMSLVPAHWDVIGDIVHLVRDKRQSNVILIGNGDVSSLDDANEKVALYGVDGIMVGRALFGNPWFFQGPTLLSERSTEERLLGMIRHTQIFERVV